MFEHLGWSIEKWRCYLFGNGNQDHGVIRVTNYYTMRFDKNTQTRMHINAHTHIEALVHTQSHTYAQVHTHTHAFA